ncbi:Lysine-rich nucleolar protein [Parasponia andersonii]|uniref:Lysine-rich nucleolar protein n=1 Tax=Parasponia andersonii TaxID=3476 RepID=A0A2P5AR97_PARAD|nr:Lysine-rich nucleolar protein [Parasponia andersonii]
MDTNLQSPQDNSDVKTAFRKPTNDAANRKYRRHSPVSRSSSDGSPKRDLSSSPQFSGEDPGRVYENRSRRKDDGRELDRDLDRSHCGRGSDAYRHSDRQFSRGSHGHFRHDDYIRHEKHVDDEERSHQRLHPRSGQESRGGTYSDHYRSRDNLRNGDKYSRDKYDSSGYKSMDKAESGRRHAYPEDSRREKRTMEKDGQDDRRDFLRSSGDYRGDPMLQHEEFKGQRSDSYSRRDDGRQHSKESYNAEVKDSDGQNLTKGGKKKNVDVETSRGKDRYIREPAEQSGEKSVLGSENQESPAKRHKFNLEKDADSRKKVSKFTTVADVKESGSSQPEDGKITAQSQAQASVFDIANDINAAKVAAMKAAEMVNKNLVGGLGTGFMTADQKKKLLWGNKKATATEESGHRWDSTLFSDRERQEKFNKLMGVKGDHKVDHRPENQGGGDLLQAEKQRELQMDLEKQYTAGLRRRDGRTVGLGL